VAAKANKQTSNHMTMKWRDLYFLPFCLFGLPVAGKADGRFTDVVPLNVD
jgi:hypothetical protein